MGLTEQVGYLERDERLDPLVKRVGDLVHAALPEAPGIRDALHGVWLGHPLHPVLTDATFGLFTGGVVLDWIGGARSHAAADKLLVLGLLSVPATVLTGATDWDGLATEGRADSGPARRVGLVHAAANVAGTAFMVLSWLARRGGARGLGRVLALLGFSAMSGGAYLGGHLAYRQGVGVDRSDGALGGLDPAPEG